MEAIGLIRVALLVATIALALRGTAGRLAPKVFVAPILFLLSRWPVLLVWMIGALGWAYVFTTTAIERGRDPNDELGFVLGMSLFLGLGVAAVVVGPIWMVVRAVARAPSFELEPGEQIERTFTANHFLRGEARGGKLLFTDRKLEFRPHKFNVQLDRWCARFAEIASVEAEGDRFVVVRLSGDPKPHWLVVFGAREVAAQIRARTSV